MVVGFIAKSYQTLYLCASNCKVVSKEEQSISHNSKHYNLYSQDTGWIWGEAICRWGNKWKNKAKITEVMTLETLVLPI